MMWQMYRAHDFQPIWCYHCAILFTRLEEALRHWESNRHARMLAFMTGEPMYYCQLCNRLPLLHEDHVVGKCHKRHLRRFGRLGEPWDEDVCLRKVLRDRFGTRRAHRVFF